jgi:hypothetical protein
VEYPEHGISKNPRDNEKHEDSKKEIETRTTSHCIKESQAYQSDMNSLKAIKQKN